MFDMEFITAHCLDLDTQHSAKEELTRLAKMGAISRQRENEVQRMLFLKSGGNSYI